MVSVKKMLIKKLTKARFNAFVAYSKPVTEFVSREIDWYADEDEKVIGTVLLDIVDIDFAAIILGRDESGVFRCIDIEISMPDQETATEWLKRVIKWHASFGKTVFQQGDETKSGVIDIFSTIAEADKIHPGFVMIRDYESHTPAKQIISEMMCHFIDIDGNFVEQFQTTGFDARVWELYLYAYINEADLFLDRSYNVPDFLVSKYGKTVCIEATTVGRNKNNPSMLLHIPKGISPPKDLEFLTDHYMPIRFGSALFSKLTKEYWKLPNVKGQPLVFAIADFHDSFSMIFSGTALIQYLYGIKCDFYSDKKGNLIITPLKIEKHRAGEKEIPSGFFFQPESEHVSAVLFSASGTISKFNRMGKLVGFGSSNIWMIRQGTCYNHNPNAAIPHVFSVEVDPKKYSETWAEGLSMYHNPNAQYPVPEELFPSIAHHFFDNGKIVSKIPEFHPYGSITHNIVVKK